MLLNKIYNPVRNNPPFFINVGIRKYDKSVCCFSYHAVASIQFGIPYTYLMFSYTRKMQDKKKKFRASVKVSRQYIGSLMGEP